MATPTVSVVIATYNYGRFLPEAIDSVLAQTFTDYEIVVVDDGSTDNTAEVIERYRESSEQAGRLRYIRLEKNIGQPKAKNLGIRTSRGRFIAFLDGDDVWLPRKLEKQMPVFEKNGDTGVVYSDVMLFQGGQEFPETKRPPFARGKVTRNLIFDNIVPFSSAIVRRECFDRDGMFDESIPLAIDYELWLRLSVNWAFDYVPEKLIKGRVGHTRLSSRADERTKIATRICDEFLSRNREKIDPSGSLRREWLALRCFREGCNNHHRNRRMLALRCYTRSLANSPFQPKVWKAILMLSLRRDVIETVKEKASRVGAAIGEPSRRQGAARKTSLASSAQPVLLKEGARGCQETPSGRPEVGIGRGGRRC
jgi:glycosyltransferase involved in cell wall biosynthesis